MSVRAFELEVREFAMFVTPGNSRAAKQRLSAQFQAAIATHHAAVGAGRLPTTTPANGTNLSGDSHHSLSFHFAL
jgi:hypothetical protein